MHVHTRIAAQRHIVDLRPLGTEGVLFTSASLFPRANHHLSLRLHSRLTIFVNIGMADSSSYESRLSRLCQKCRHLLIDDKALGGYRSESGPGTASFLEFDDGYVYRCFDTDYDVQDSYPELSLLAESARAGCECCAYIRETILTTGLESPEGCTRIMLECCYSWKFEWLDHVVQVKGRDRDRGLAAMLLYVYFMPQESSSSEEPLSQATIAFSIDSASGMS
jgi:hypothetical protein